MEHEVTELKHKIKNLQKQLCDRTRNYLYHFKKSPQKKYITKQIQTQTDLPLESSLEHTTQTESQDHHFENVHLITLSIPSSMQKPSDPPEHKDQKTIDQFQISQLNPVPVTLNLQQNEGKLKSELQSTKEKHQRQIDSLTLQIKTMKQQLQDNMNSHRIYQNQLSSFSTFSNNTTPNKEAENNQFSKKKQAETIEELSESKFDGQNSRISLQNQHLAKEIKIMKKQLKKLKTHLQREVKLSSETKHALLISEEENYKFRLQIQRLNKDIQILTGTLTDTDSQKSFRPFNLEEQPGLKSVDSGKSQSTKQELQKFKNQSEKYEEHILILEGVKKDYLKKCIEAKEQVFKLKLQTEKLKKQIHQMKLQIQQLNNLLQQSEQTLVDNKKSPDQPLAEKQSIAEKWTEIFKSKIHQISNCLPVTDNQEVFLFRPETIEEVISMLERILKFCKNVETWQKQKIQAIEKQRSNLLKIISSIIIRHPQTKQVIAEEISQIEELKYLVNFMNKQYKGSSRSQGFLQYDSIDDRNDQIGAIESI